MQPPELHSTLGGTAGGAAGGTHLVLQGGAQEEVDDLVLLHRQREQVDLLQALDLALQAGRRGTNSWASGGGRARGLKVANRSAAAAKRDDNRWAAALIGCTATADGRGALHDLSSSMQLPALPSSPLPPGAALRCCRAALRCCRRARHFSAAILHAVPSSPAAQQRAGQSSKADGLHDVRRSKLTCCCIHHHGGHLPSSRLR
jgi:hypothetical protein